MVAKAEIHTIEQAFERALELLKSEQDILMEIVHAGLPSPDARLMAARACVAGMAFGLAMHCWAMQIPLPKNGKAVLEALRPVIEREMKRQYEKENG